VVRVTAGAVSSPSDVSGCVSVDWAVESMVAALKSAGACSDVASSSTVDGESASRRDEGVAVSDNDSRDPLFFLVIVSVLLSAPAPGVGDAAAAASAATLPSVSVVVSPPPAWSSAAAGSATSDSAVPASVSSLPVVTALGAALGGEFAAEPAASSDGLALESDGAANATPGTAAIPIPIPSATANPPMRPMYAA
jgi:hypothetical protein